MNPLVFVAAVAVIGVGAGIAGALFGLGGGIFLVPALTLLFHVNIKYAIGASIVSVIATSSGAAAAYVRDRLTNVRVGMLLEIATVTGALSGAYLTGLLAPRWLYVIFGTLLLYSIVPMVVRRGIDLPPPGPADPLTVRLGLAGVYHDAATGREVAYAPRRVSAGAGMMYVAGLISGLLGIGSGIFKVLAMDVVMRLPLKVSTATSNFMIGVTAAASASVYFARGDINPLVAAPVALGVLGGAWIGTRLMLRAHPQTLRVLFIPILAYIGVTMIVRGLGL
ncbi:MAG: sulfite exporter TauE/SafE family protein [Armatimonadota bacterium]|nr:sulfite exporter TauE/SafE family protein [Armatimonadota bacterium]